MMNQPESLEANTNGRRRLNPSAGDTAGTSEALEEIVRRHCVCYEVEPEWSMSGGRPIRVGFSISLCGIPENAAGQPDVPGSGHCWRTYYALRRVAESILPEEERSCWFDVGAFDRSWHVAPSVRRGRNETVFTIKILHRRNFNAPIDDCQHQCLTEMRSTLSRLTIRENIWAATSPK